MRWATFDCYGTLVDWNGGIGGELGRIFGEPETSRLLARYHEIEPVVQEQNPTMPYREVLATVLEQIAGEEGHALGAEEREALSRSLPQWPVFPEVGTALTEAQRRGFRLVILSNTDRDLIDASMRRIGVDFEFAIVASKIGSYKPARGHWDAFFEQSGADLEQCVHVGASIHHDIRPARTLGIPCVWINRLGETSDVTPDRELPDLSGLPDALDELLPA